MVECISSSGAEVKDKEDNMKVTGSKPGDFTVFNSFNFWKYPFELKNIVIFVTGCAAKAFFILPYNELAIAQGPKIHQKKEL